MTDDMPEATHKHKATAALDEFMATVLRHLRMGEGNPLEELGLTKSADELQNWHSDIPDSKEDRNNRVSAQKKRPPTKKRN